MEVKSKEIKLVHPDELTPHQDNPNAHSQEQIERIKKLITETGWRQPIIVSKLSNQIVSGHGRLTAAKELELKTVPVIYQDFISEEEEYNFLVADNAIGRWAKLDMSKINQKTLELGPFDTDLLGIKNFEIEPLEKLDERPQKKDKHNTEYCPNCGVELE